MSERPPASRIRAELRAARRAIARTVADAAARAAAERANDLPELAHAAHVGSYAARDGELDPAQLDLLLTARGVTLWRPVATEHRLQWVRWRPGDPTAPGDYGIPVPLGDAVESPPLDAVIVPLVAVDRRGNRMGHGEGFYDRAFSTTLRDVEHRIGFAHDLQVIADITAEPWDVAMHVVVTPSEVIRARQ